MYTEFISNLAPVATVRTEVMDGVTYTVVPMVMITEGVHNGSNGKLFYSTTELSKTPAVWNGRPIVVYHPLLQGTAGSAADPTVFTKQKVGYVMNTQWDETTKKLRAEAWINMTKAQAVDVRVVEAIQNATPMEVSTGLFADYVPTPGEWNGEAYDYVVSNCRPDHLAILPDQVGACSLADGAGLLIANALSDDNARSIIRLALRERFGSDSEDGPYVYVEDMFPDFVVYELGNKLYRLPIIRSDDSAVIAPNAEPEPVVRVTEYRTLMGSFIGNSSALRSLRKDKDMTKKELVTALIANEATTWKEADRPTLEALTEDVLQAIVANSKSKEAPAQDTPAPAAAPAPAAPVAPAPEPATQNKGPATMQDFLASAPVELHAPLQEMLSGYGRMREKAIETIVANAENVFTSEELAQFSLPQLQKLEALALNKAAPATKTNGFSLPSYFGQATPQATHNASLGTKQEALVPVSVFDDVK